MVDGAPLAARAYLTPAMKPSSGFGKLTASAEKSGKGVGYTAPTLVVGITAPSAQDILGDFSSDKEDPVTELRALPRSPFSCERRRVTPTRRNCYHEF